MARPGWIAKDLLLPLWNRYGNGDIKARRDQLARAAGTSGSVLSSINSGKRRLGSGLASRLADELGVSLAELGAPDAVANDPASLRLRDRLETLAGVVDELTRNQDRILHDLADARTRLSQLEARGEHGEGESKRRRGQ